MFGRIKDWRRIHTRYDRYAHTFMSAIDIAGSENQRGEADTKPIWRRSALLLGRRDIDAQHILKAAPQ